MSSYVKPQVLVFQAFNIVPTEITEPLRAHIAGPHAVLHRHSNVAEKPHTFVGEYNRLNDTTYSWPQRAPGSLVDNSYTKVYIDGALLQYYNTAEDPAITSGAEVYAPHDRQENNVVRSPVLAFKANGSAYPRSAVFKDRDVQLGDVVHLTHVDSESCDVTELWTTVTGFSRDNVPSRIKPATAAVQNQGSLSAAQTVTKLAGLESEVPEVEAGTGYDGLASGHVTEEYTFEVVRSAVVGCNAARLRVVSASGTDDVSEVTPDDNEAPIGTRGLVVTFDDQTKLKLGQKWRVVVQQTFIAGAAVADADDYDSEMGSLDLLSAYTGEKNDVYVVECTKGGLYAQLPEIMVYTTKGLDFSGPTEVTAKNTSISIGTNGVKVKFSNDGGLRKGDKWYITVVSSKAGPVRELRLRDDIPVAMRCAPPVMHTMSMELYIKDDIQVSKNRIGFAPEQNYTVEPTQITVRAGVVAYHPEWTSAGAQQPLNVYAGKVYVEYREWLTALADTVESISDVANIDQIAGPLDIDNPLKWGVYKALSNSNGTVVKYTAVANPASLDSWAQVLRRIKGRDDMYNLVPLTFDRAVHDLWAAHINAESNEVENNWKAGFFSLKAAPVVKLVGSGVAIGGVLANVVEDDVLATLSDDPAASGTQYTKLQVTTGNGYFIANNVQPGDHVRYNYTVDAFGDEQYEEYVVDKVLSENTLLLYTGGDAAVTVPSRVEIYHNRNRNEIADDIAQQGGSLSSRRVCAVWPDEVGAAGVTQPGYYLSAALGGLVSGVVPHQPLTNVEVAGFDDYSRSYKYFNETQLNRMAEAGVWIVTEDKDGTPYTRHALTTDNLDLNRREEAIRRNVDSMSYLFLRRLRPFIGRTNVQDGMIRRLRYEIDSAIDLLTTNNFTDSLGAQLISGTIRTLQIHPLLKDRIEIVLDLVVPAPLNNIQLHLVV